MYVLHYLCIYIFLYNNTSGSIYVQLCTTLVFEKNINLEEEKCKVDQFNIIICGYELFAYVISFKNKLGETLYYVQY